MVFFRLLEIEDPQARFLQLTPVVAEAHLHAVFQQGVFIPVDGERRLAGAGFPDLPDSIPIGVFGQTGIEFFQFFPEIAFQQHLPVGLAPQQSIRPEGLLVESIDRLPAERVAQIICGGLLHQGVFGVVGSCGKLSIHQAGEEKVAGFL